MDPLSITASIIAVLQATNAVISICYDYSAALKHSSWELPRVTDEIKSLRNVLETLEQLAKAESAQLPTLNLLCEPKGPLVMCLARLESLGKKLAPPNWSGHAGSKRIALIQALGWPLKEGDTKKALEDIGRFKTTLHLAMTADQATMILSIREMVQAIHSSTLDVQKDFTQLHESFVSMRMDGKRREIHRWLSPPDPSLNHNAACKKRQAKTGTWFIRSQQFSDWKTKPNSFLWLHGIPGCGKTILTSTIVEEVLQLCPLGRNLAVAYFYFDFNDIEKQQHEKMVRSLIAHLSIQSANTPQALESLFSSCTNGERQPTTNALLETLRQIVQAFDETFIILDALDECKERQELLDDIETFVGWKTEKLHLLATSRREKDIEEGIEPFINDEERICIQTALVNDDIQAYVHERLQTDRKLRRWQKMPKVQQEIERALMDKADGMFRWAACQLDELGKCLRLLELQEALASLPTTLDDTYARILGNIHKRHSRHALKILQWLTYSARPLRIEEVAEVIAVDIEGNPRFDPEKRLPEPRDILTICSSLITVTTKVTHGIHGQTIEEQVRLAHFSVKEYLVSERIQSGPGSEYSIREIAANTSIAETCLVYLLQFEYPGSLTPRTTEEYPLAMYAAKHWTQHAQVSEKKDASAILWLITEFFLNKRDAYVNWIRIFDPDESWNLLDIRKSREKVASPLYYASRAGLVESVTLLLGKGADVNAQGGLYGNALQAASVRGHDQIVERLLGKGADVNAQGGRYGNALQAASVRGHDQIVERLLGKGADVNAQGGRYGNALQAASAEGHDQIVERLLGKGADVNAQGGRYGNALQAASAEGHDQIVERLLGKGADVNAQGGRYGNALQAASAGGHDQIVERLLGKGADVNAQGGRYGNALQAASAGGHDQIVERLLGKGADVNAQGGGHYGNALQAASAGGHDQIVERLLGKGADVNAQGGGHYGNALQAASAGGHDQIVERLLGKGADVNAQGGHYGNALQAASAGGHDQIVERLLGKGADVNAQGGHYGNALQAASAEGHDQIVQRLLEKGADVNAQGGHYGNALQAASAEGHDQIVQRLLEKGADVNAQGGGVYGNALQAASAEGYDQIVQRLLEKGADVNAQGGGVYGNALQAASAEGYDQIVERLLEKGADVNAQGGHYGNALQAASAGGHDQIVERLLGKGAKQ